MFVGMMFLMLFSHSQLVLTVFAPFQDNSIHYWKKFVTEYFAPRAKKRWCLSLYDNMKSNLALGVFPQATMVSVSLILFLVFIFYCLNAYA